MSKSSSVLRAGRPSARADNGASLDRPVMRRVNFDLPAELHARLKIYAAKRGVTVADILRQFVESLDDQESK